MPSPLPSLTTADVQRRVGSGAFGRSRLYVSRLENMRREGRTLFAACQGTQAVPYDVTVTFGTDRIVRASCSCPVGDGGTCKHVAALLQTWIRDPNDFAETQPVEAALASRTPQELIALIDAMVTRHPGLRDLLDMPGAGAVRANAVRAQIRRAFSVDLYAWGSALQIARHLARIVGQADTYAEHADWANASTVALTLLDSVQEQYEMVQDEDGDLGAIVDDCVGILGRCLEHTTDETARKRLIEALFEVLTWDIAIGGIDLGFEAREILQTHATNAERDALGWQIDNELRRLPPSTRAGGDWRRQALGGLRIDLHTGEMDDEVYLDLCRRSGRVDDLVDALLERERVDEAAEAIHTVSNLALIALASLFDHHDQSVVLDTVALERLDGRADWRLTEWIQRRERGDAGLALRLLERRFHNRPSAAQYVEALELAQTLDCEDEVRTRLRATLAAGTHHAAQIQAHLYDGEHHEALALVHLPSADWAKGARDGWGASSQATLRLSVAKAVASTHPDDALQIYLDAAADRIERRGRSHYADAARHLVEARDLFRTNPDLGSWSGFMAELREEFKGLPALRDELSKAGL